MVALVPERDGPFLPIKTVQAMHGTSAATCKLMELYCDEKFPILLSRTSDFNSAKLFLDKDVLQSWIFYRQESSALIFIFQFQFFRKQVLSRWRV